MRPNLPSYRAALLQRFHNPALKHRTWQIAMDGSQKLPQRLLGTIRDHVTRRRRPFVRFFACEQDLSHEPLDAPLPDAVTSGAEPYLVVGAMAGG